MRNGATSGVKRVHFGHIRARTGVSLDRRIYLILGETQPTPYTPNFSTSRRFQTSEAI
jgi:hypothetical protein